MYDSHINQFHYLQLWESNKVYFREVCLTLTESTQEYGLGILLCKEKSIQCVASVKEV